MKCWVGWLTSWNQDHQEEYQKSQISSDTTLMAESKEEIKSLLMKVKEWKSWLKTQHSKMKILASSPIAAAKSLESCLTLCDPIDGRPPGSPSLGFSRQEHWRGLPFPSPMHETEKWKWSRSVVSNSSQPHGLQPARLLHPWDFPGKSTGMGCHCLLL